MNYEPTKEQAVNTLLYHLIREAAQASSDPLSLLEHYADEFIDEDKKVRRDWLAFEFDLPDSLVTISINDWEGILETVRDEIEAEIEVADKQRNEDDESYQRSVL